jgi:hypothetical protein
MMHLNLYRKSGRIQTHLVGDTSAYHGMLQIINHPWARFYRVTLTDPLAGDRILRDSYIDQKEKA